MHIVGGAPEADAEKEVLKEEVARLRGERTRVKGLKAQLERSMAALADQRAAFLKQQVRTSSLKWSCLVLLIFKCPWRRWPTSAPGGSGITAEVMLCPSNVGRLCPSNVSQHCAG